MGLAEARVPVDKKGVVVLGGLGRHRLGRGEGQLVGGPHHEVLEGELVTLKKVFRLLLRRLRLLIGLERRVAEETDGEIRGEDVLHAGGDIAHKAVLNGAALEVIAAVEDQGVPLQGHGGDLVEPGVDGGLIELRAHLVQHHVPNVLYGIQKVGSFPIPRAARKPAGAQVFL